MGRGRRAAAGRGGPGVLPQRGRSRAVRGTTRQQRRPRRNGSPEWEPPLGGVGFTAPPHPPPRVWALGRVRAAAHTHRHGLLGLGQEASQELSGPCWRCGAARRGVTWPGTRSCSCGRRAKRAWPTRCSSSRPTAPSGPRSTGTVLHTFLCSFRFGSGVVLVFVFVLVLVWGKRTRCACRSHGVGVTCVLPACYLLWCCVPVWYLEGTGRAWTCAR